jgi:hypothetical protein
LRGQFEGVWYLDYNTVDVGGEIYDPTMTVFRDGECSVMCRHFEECGKWTSYSFIKEKDKLKLRIKGDCEFCGDFDIEPSAEILKNGLPDTIHLVKGELNLKMVSHKPY